ncbi:MAG: aminotransferase class I/II-fold pyridoxal phosphate-dependent enzyme [Pseudomonadota bacterium]|jgi:cysteine-S-conjugate beta-lyase|nr:MAG: aminotransferase [Rhodobacterales bacterium 32-66-9]
MPGFDFDTLTDRRGTHSSQWDNMETLFGVSPKDGLGMWTADSDYATAPCVRDVVRAAADHSLFGYFADYRDYHDAIAWWMRTRHGWTIENDWILTTQGLGNAVALCIDVWSQPGDAVVIFTPVYHEFARKITTAGRVVTECPLARVGDRYELDLEDAQSRLTGNEKFIIWCSPQNPSGRIWTVAELNAVADFAARNGLLLVSDEVHHDLVYRGQTFVPMAVAAPEARDRLITATAASKTFNIAGQKTGNLIIADARLRGEMAARLRSLDYVANGLGLRMVTAAYSAQGAAWADAQMLHLDSVRQIFDAGVNAIPGVRSLPLQSTYLGWVDFSGTGMSDAEILARVHSVARIAAAPGPQFGAGGEGLMRFTLATSHARVAEAVSRLERAFADLQ